MTDDALLIAEGRDDKRLIFKIRSRNCDAHRCGHVDVGTMKLPVRDTGRVTTKRAAAGALIAVLAMPSVPASAGALFTLDPREPALAGADGGTVKLRVGRSHAVWDVALTGGSKFARAFATPHDAVAWSKTGNSSLRLVTLAAPYFEGQSSYSGQRYTPSAFTYAVCTAKYDCLKDAGHQEAVN